MVHRLGRHDRRYFRRVCGLAKRSVADVKAIPRAHSLDFVLHPLDLSLSLSLDADDIGCAEQKPNWSNSIGGDLVPDHGWSHRIGLLIRASADTHSNFSFQTI